MTQDVVSFRGIAQRLEVGDGVVLRCFVESDLPALVDVVNRNLDTLRPWMPWAQEPVTVEAQTVWWRDSAAMRRAGTGFNYGIFDASGQVIGGTGFHVRNGPGVLEIGYWLDAAHTGRGIVTAVSRVLTEHARTIEGVTSVEIHCDPANVKSAAVPQRLGYHLVGERPTEITAPGCTGRLQIWRFDLSPS